MNVSDKIVLGRLVKQASLGAGVAKTTIQDYWVAPCDGVVLAMVCCASGIAGVTPKISVYVNGVEKTTEHTIAAINTAYRMAFTSGSTSLRLAKGDKVTLRCSTQAGAGQLTNPSVAMVFEPGQGVSKNALVAKLHAPGSVGHTLDYSMPLDKWIAPCKCRVDGAWVIGTGKAGSPDPAVRLYKNTTILAAAVAIAANDTVYPFILNENVRTISKGDVLMNSCTTEAAVGDLVSPCCILLITPLEQVPSRWLVDKFKKSRVALGAGVRHTVVQDLLALPFDAWLTKARFMASGRAGFTAEKAYIDMVGDAGCTNMDTVFEAHSDGHAGRNRQIAMIDDAAGVLDTLNFATAGCVNLDGVLTFKTVGVSGWQMVVAGGSKLAAGVQVYEDTVNKLLTILFENGVSTQGAVATALAGTTNFTLVGGTPLNVLAVVADDLPPTALAGGAPSSYVTVSGNLLTIHFENAVTTVAEAEALVTALSGTDDIIDVKTGGTGANILTTADDVVAAINLDHGTDGNPTYTVAGGSSEIPPLPVVQTANATELNLSMVEGGVDRKKIVRNTVLSMRATTLPATGQSENPVMMLWMEY